MIQLNTGGCTRISMYAFFKILFFKVGVAMLNHFILSRNGHVLNLGFYPDYLGKNIINSLYVCFVTNYCTQCVAFVL